MAMDPSKSNSTARQDLREMPIPIRYSAGTALDYHDIPIALDSDQSKEPLVDATEYGLAISCFYARNDGLNAPYYKRFASALDRIWLRKMVAEKLKQVNESLAPYKAELLLLDGYRPISLQKELWTHFIQQAKIVMENPSEIECVQFAGLYCSDPSAYDENDCRTWPTHNTGGAVDLMLRSVESKEPLFFGGVFDDASELSSSDYFERIKETRISASLTEARRNRRLLYWSMLGAGFANFPYEWWHFDFGTQMWVMNGRADAQQAFYGKAEPPQ